MNNLWCSWYLTYMTRHGTHGWTTVVTGVSHGNSGGDTGYQPTLWPWYASWKCWYTVMIVCNWGEPAHLANGIPCDLCMYLCVIHHSVNKYTHAVRPTMTNSFSKYTHVEILWTSSILQCVITSVNATTFKILRLLQFCMCNGHTRRWWACARCC